MLAIFWASVSVLAWTHVVFPVVLLVRGALRARPVVGARAEPSVSVIVAAHNEASNIGARLDNLAAQTYPTDRLEILVASDGSTDDTVAIASSRARVRVLDLPRVGKPAALNAAVAQAGGEILVFSDANTQFSPDAVAELVAPFGDPEIGGVAGDQRYLPGAEGAGERSHWALDRQLKLAESRAGSAVSATGAIYAIRRELYEPVPAGVTDDFYISTGVIRRDRRLVFAPHAVAWERTAATDRREYPRKVRIITQGLTALLRHRRDLLDPRRHGFYALQLLTHKLLRRLTALPLLAIAASTTALAIRRPAFRLAVVAQAVVYGLGIMGLFGGARVQSRILRLPAFFCMANVAALHALVNVALGINIDRWNPTHVEPHEQR